MELEQPPRSGVRYAMNVVCVRCAMHVILAHSGPRCWGPLSYWAEEERKMMRPAYVCSSWLLREVATNPDCNTYTLHVEAARVHTYTYRTIPTTLQESLRHMNMHEGRYIGLCRTYAYYCTRYRGSAVMF
jgi:hypothetical protein